MIRILSLVLMGTMFLGGAAAAAMPVEPPPGIILSTNDRVCGQVTITANGIAIESGATYQLVADRSVLTAVASGNTVSATFSLAQSGAWGNVAIRTASGGYLAASTNLGPGLAWYHVIAC